MLVPRASDWKLWRGPKKIENQFSYKTWKGSFDFGPKYRALQGVVRKAHFYLEKKLRVPRVLKGVRT